MPWCINNIETEFCAFRVCAMLTGWGLAVFSPKPKAGCCRGCNCDTAFLLLLHPIHRGRAIMHFTNLVRPACIIENALCCGGLAGIDVRHNTKITVTFQRILSRHGLQLRLQILKLPTIMRKRTVGFSHFVSVFTFFYSVAAIICSVHQLAR